MVKKILTVLFACLMLVGGYGCGGESAKAPEGAASIGQEANQKRIDEIRQKQSQGQPLTGKEKRLLQAAGDAPAAAPSQGDEGGK